MWINFLNNLNMFLFVMETRILFLLREEILKAVWLKLSFLLLKAVREDWTTLTLRFETLLSEETSMFFFFLFHGA